MKPGGRVLVIAWREHLDRATMFAQHFKAEMVHISYMPMETNPVWLVPIRYVVQWVKAWKVLFSKRPRYVHVTNPPFMAALNVWGYCKLTGAEYIMDTHSPALFSKKWGWTLPLQRFLAKRAAVNIVDQERFKRMFESWGAKAVILTKPPGTPVKVENVEVQPEPQDTYPVMVVNTFAPDEPVEPILGAARALPGVKFYVTGSTEFANRDMIDAAPENVVFTGFLGREDYWRQMIASRVVIVLTTYPYSLLGGAQDGMVLGRPLILSKQPSLTDYFTKGTVFVDNTAEGIINGIREARQHEEALTHQIQELAVEKRELWQTNFRGLQRMVGETDLTLSAS